MTIGDIPIYRPLHWPLAHGRALTLGPVAVIMGILNVTPDSFTDGGRFATRQEALDHAARMVREGAAIVDVGGESTRPGAAPVSAAEEQDRVLPVIEALVRQGEALISVDTWRASTARLAVNAGAHIINDIWGLQRDPDMARAVAETGAGVVAMHNSRERKVASDVIEDQYGFLRRSLAVARDAGIPAERIVLDPGFGFGKERPEINLELMARFEELRGLHRPLLVGVSRKRFIGHLTGRDGAGRDVGTAAAGVCLRLKGACVFRVHDVAINADALKVADAMLALGRAA